jgi:hypothetical protein
MGRLCLFILAASDLVPLLRSYEHLPCNLFTQTSLLLNIKTSILKKEAVYACKTSESAYINTRCHKLEEQNPTKYIYCNICLSGYATGWTTGEWGSIPSRDGAASPILRPIQPRIQWWLSPRGRIPHPTCVSYIYGAEAWCWRSTSI